MASQSDGFVVCGPPQTGTDIFLGYADLYRTLKILYRSRHLQDSQVKIGEQVRDYHDGLLLAIEGGGNAIGHPEGLESRSWGGYPKSDRFCRGGLSDINFETDYT